MKRTEVWLCVAACIVASSYCVHQISLSVKSHGRLPEIHAARHRGTSYDFFPQLTQSVFFLSLLTNLSPSPPRSVETEGLSLLRGLECLVRESWLMNVHSERKRAMLIPPEHSSCFHCACAVAMAAVVHRLPQTSCLSLEFQSEAPLCLRRSTWSVMLINCLTTIYLFNIAQTCSFILFIFTLRFILDSSYLYCYYFTHFRMIIKPSKLWNNK